MPNGKRRRTRNSYEERAAAAPEAFGDTKAETLIDPSPGIFLSRVTLAHTLDGDTERLLGIAMPGSRCVRSSTVESIELIAPMTALIKPKKGPRVWVQIAMGMEA